MMNALLTFELLLNECIMGHTLQSRQPIKCSKREMNRSALLQTLGSGPVNLLARALAV